MKQMLTFEHFFFLFLNIVYLYENIVYTIKKEKTWQKDM